MAARIRTWQAAVLAAVLSAAAPAPAASGAPPDDAYLAGYAAAVLEREFDLSAPSLRVRSGVVTLAAGDLAGADRARVIAALSRIRGVSLVEVLPPGSAPSGPPGAAPAESGGARAADGPELQTGWLPGGTLFRPLIADPRWPHFAASYQYYLNDPQLGDVGAASFGETFTLYRDRLGGGWAEVGLQAGVFALFDLDSSSFDLVNADYFVALVGAWRAGSVSALGRVFHQSSHLGDEFLLRNRIPRVNLSFEGIDLRASYEFWPGLRVYGGGGYLFDREPRDVQPWLAQGGVEFRSPWPGAGARVRPLAGVDLQSRETNDWNVDLSLRAGVELPGVLATRSLQLLLEYFSGNSPNGQFYRRRIDYFGLGAHFHF